MSSGRCKSASRRVGVALVSKEESEGTEGGARVRRRGHGLGLAILALALVAGWGCSRQPSRSELAAWDAEIRALEATRDSLRLRSAELVAADPRIRDLPKGDVVISVPTLFLRTVIERIFEDVAGRATISLGGIKAHVAKKVKKIVTIGEFVVDVDIHEVVGYLRPGQPKVTFGNNVIDMSLPIEVHKGGGAATIHFLWNGKNVADLACGDMDITRTLTADVIPSRYRISGRMKLAVEGSTVICTPVFPETRIRVKVKPSRASWEAIDSILAEKHGVCGWVLDKVDVPSLLKRLVEDKGFNVKPPINKSRPLGNPGGVADQQKGGDRGMAGPNLARLTAKNARTLRTWLPSLNRRRAASW